MEGGVNLEFNVNAIRHTRLRVSIVTTLYLNVVETIVFALNQENGVVVMVHTPKLLSRALIIHVILLLSKTSKVLLFFDKISLNSYFML